MGKLHHTAAGLHVSWASTKKGPIWGLGGVPIPCDRDCCILWLGKASLQGSLKHNSSPSLERERCYHVLHGEGNEDKTSIPVVGARLPRSFNDPSKLYPTQ